MTTVSGVVEARNDTGIRVNGSWLNRSKFKPVDLPDVGTLVTLGLDPKGFIVSLEVLDGEMGRAGAGDNITGTRDRTISRLAVLKAAAYFAATRTDIKSGDVLRICDNWLAWVELRD